MTGYMYLDPIEVGQVVVKKTDGSTWLCEYDTSGHLVPVKELTPPPPKPKPLPPSKPKPSEGEDDDDVEQEEGIPRSTGAYDPLKTGSGPKKLGDNPQAKTTPIIPKLDDTVFRQRLSSIMTDNKYDRHLKGRTRGKLDMTRLPKVMTNSTSVFTQKQSRKNKLYNVVLIVDQSGSMWHSDEYRDEQDLIQSGKTRIAHAADVTTFIAKSMVGLNVNLAILGFNHYNHIYKNFNESILDYPKLHAEIIERVNYGGSCNHDYDALAMGYKMLKGREGKNIVLFISDGQPATCGFVDEFLQRPPERWKGNGRVKRKDYGRESEMYVDVDAGRKSAPWRDKRTNLNYLVTAHNNLATTIGIGIQTECWQVPDNVRVNDLTDMKPKVIEILQRKIKRG